MTPKLQHEVHLRPVDLARDHGLSTQAIRNYEATGILPAAARSSHGYRTYTPLHAHALRAFLALQPGHGHRTATEILQAVNRGATADALRLIDESHAQLLDDRRTLTAVETALRALDPAPPEHDRPTPSAARDRATPSAAHDRAAPSTGRAGRTDRVGRDSAIGPAGHDRVAAGRSTAGRGDTFVGPLSRRLGIRPATLRKWERAGLVEPRRDPQTGYRVYSEADVRDALLVHQLRRGGYLLEQIAPVIAQVRSAGGVEPLESMLADWRARLSAKGRAMLAGAAALDAYLEHRSASAH
jgi:DNA-binding transcriptional MerR regulator